MKPFFYCFAQDYIKHWHDNSILSWYHSSSVEKSWRVLVNFSLFLCANDDVIHAKAAAVAKVNSFTSLKKFDRGRETRHLFFYGKWWSAKVIARWSCVHGQAFQTNVTNPANMEYEREILVRRKIGRVDHDNETVLWTCEQVLSRSKSLSG
jgi:hypothetical protein